MSYDISFQGFRDGEATDGGGRRMMAVLEPWVVAREPAHHYLLIRCGDDEADLYLRDDSAMATHIGGRTMDALVRGARAAGWVILLPDGPACLTHEDQRPELPAELADDAVVVRSGDDLAEVIRSS